MAGIAQYAKSAGQALGNGELGRPKGIGTLTDSLWGAIGLSTGAGLLGSVGGMLTEKLLGGGESEAESMVNSAKDMADWAIGRGQSLTQASMFNAAGDTGATVKANFEKYKDSVGNSAKGLMEYAKQSNLADQLLSNATSQGNAMTQALKRNAGDITNKAMSFSSLAGQPAGAVGANAAGAADATNRSILEGLAATGDLYNRAITGASSITGQAAQSRMQDKEQMYNQYVQPYMAQINQGVGNMVNNAMDVGFKSSQQGQTMVDNYQPLKGLEYSVGTALKPTWEKSMLGSNLVG